MMQFRKTTSTDSNSDGSDLSTSSQNNFQRIYPKTVSVLFPMITVHELPKSIQSDRRFRVIHPKCYNSTK